LKAKSANSTDAIIRTLDLWT